MLKKLFNKAFSDVSISISIGGSGNQQSENGLVMGKGDVVSKDRKVESFNGIDISGAIDVKFTNAKKPYLKVAAQESLHKYIETEILQGKLFVKIADNKDANSMTFFSRKPITIECGSPDIGSATVRGSGMVSLKSIEANALKLSVTGSGDIKASGTCNDLSATVMGSGDIDASKLKVRNATLDVFGSGDIDAFCTESLDAKISGSGDITIKGSPPNIKEKIKGSGDLKIH